MHANLCPKMQVQKSDSQQYDPMGGVGDDR